MEGFEPVLRRGVLVLKIASLEGSMILRVVRLVRNSRLELSGPPFFSKNYCNQLKSNGIFSQSPNKS